MPLGRADPAAPRAGAPSERWASSPAVPAGGPRGSVPSAAERAQRSESPEAPCRLGRPMQPRMAGSGPRRPSVRLGRTAAGLQAQSGRRDARASRRRRTRSRSPPQRSRQGRWPRANALAVGEEPCSRVPSSESKLNRSWRPRPPGPGVPELRILLEASVKIRPEVDASPMGALRPRWLGTAAR